MKPARETELYPPVKRFLEAQGYTVKAEIGPADVVAIRGDEDPVIVEMKTGFSLGLVHQAVERLSVVDCVYVAIPEPAGRAGTLALRRNLKLCRRLGLGLLGVRVADGHVTPHLDPGPYAPRRSSSRRGRLLREFARRVGDPNAGGAVAGQVVTAYRQDARKCAAVLHRRGPTRAAAVAAEADVAAARRIMADDHYGWFERVARGVYALTPRGAREAL